MHDLIIRRERERGGIQNVSADRPESPFTQSCHIQARRRDVSQTTSGDLLRRKHPFGARQSLILTDLQMPDCAVQVSSHSAIYTAPMAVPRLDPDLATSKYDRAFRIPTASNSREVKTSARPPVAFIAVLVWCSLNLISILCSMNSLRNLNVWVIIASV